MVALQMSLVIRDIVMTWLDCTQFPNHYNASEEWFVHISKMSVFMPDKT